MDYIEDTVDYVIPMINSITGYDELKKNMKYELIDLCINRLNVRKVNLIALYKLLIISIFSRRARKIYKKVLKAKDN